MKLATTSKPRFLHLIRDDKFIDAAHDLFEEAMPGAHEYVVLTAAQSLRHIKRFQPHQIRLGEWLSRKCMQRLSGYTAVFIHFLSSSARHVVAHAPSDTCLVWVGWGADYYHLIQDRTELLLPRTRALLAGMTAHAPPRSRQLRPMLRKSGDALQHPIATFRHVRRLIQDRPFREGARREYEILNRFDYFAPVLAQEFDTIRSRHPDFRADFAAWNYWIEGFGDDRSEPTINHAKRILVGNSATPESNHADTLALLDGILPEDWEIVCPLSYGDRVYADAVASMGRERFGDRFVAIRDFMPATAYEALLKSCSVVVMNHIRQQALGNIALALWHGARVFINAASPVKEAMRDIGVPLPGMQELHGYLEHPQPAETHEILRVRRCLEKRFGRVFALERTRNLLTLLCTHRSATSSGGMHDVNARRSRAS